MPLSPKSSWRKFEAMVCRTSAAWVTLVHKPGFDQAATAERSIRRGSLATLTGGATGCVGSAIEATTTGALVATGGGGCGGTRDAMMVRTGAGVARVAVESGGSRSRGSVFGFGAGTRSSWRCSEVRCGADTVASDGCGFRRARTSRATASTRQIPATRNQRLDARGTLAFVTLVVIAPASTTALFPAFPRGGNDSNPPTRNRTFGSRHHRPIWVVEDALVEWA